MAFSIIHSKWSNLHYRRATESYARGRGGEKKRRGEEREKMPVVGDLVALTHLSAQTTVSCLAEKKGEGKGGGKRKSRFGVSVPPAYYRALHNAPPHLGGREKEEKELFSRSLLRRRFSAPFFISAWERGKGKGGKKKEDAVVRAGMFLRRRQRLEKKKKRGGGKKSQRTANISATIHRPNKFFDPSGEKKKKEGGGEGPKYRWRSLYKGRSIKSLLFRHGKKREKRAKNHSHDAPPDAGFNCRKKKRKGRKSSPLNDGVVYFGSGRARQGEEGKNRSSTPRHVYSGTARG